MNTEEKMDELFGGTPKLWKGNYKVFYCDLCDGVEIICPDCNQSSCCGGTCPKCHDDSVEYSKKTKSSEWSYLSEEERKTQSKLLYLRRYILACIREGFYEINWKWLYEEGHFSREAEELFAKELKKALIVEA